MAENLSVGALSASTYPVSGDRAADSARQSPAGQPAAGGTQATGDQAQISAKGRALASQGSGSAKTDANGLTNEQNEEVRKMKETDRQVRLHEQAHISAGGSLVHGGASYTFRTGPDGNRYAVAGEVNIDTSKENTPDATIRKAAHIRSAALAPADPSAQDRAVAAQADQMATDAALEKLSSKNKSA